MKQRDFKREAAIIPILSRCCDEIVNQEPPCDCYEYRQVQRQFKVMMECFEMACKNEDTPTEAVEILLDQLSLASEASREVFRKHMDSCFDKK
jgi:hypothetical protein